VNLALLLAPLVAVASGGAEDPTYDRLFGEASVPQGEVASVEPVSPWTPIRLVAPAILGGMGLLALWQLRRRRTPPTVSGSPLISVLSRQPMGDRGALVLVEVEEQEGGRRRLLVGTGGGSPTLVSDLGTNFEASVIEEVLAERNRLSGEA